MNDREQERLVEEFDLEPDTWDDFERAEKTAFLAAIMRPGESDAEAAASLEELERLADTAGIEVLGTYTQRRGHPERASFFGKGFLEEISQKMRQAQAEVLIVNEELTPLKVRNIENNFGIRAIHRTQVILSIFHDRARNREAKRQVRLA